MDCPSQYRTWLLKRTWPYSGYQLTAASMDMKPLRSWRMRKVSWISVIPRYEKTPPSSHKKWRQDTTNRTATTSWTEQNKSSKSEMCPCNTAPMTNELQHCPLQDTAEDHLARGSAPDQKLYGDLAALRRTAAFIFWEELVFPSNRGHQGRRPEDGRHNHTQWLYTQMENR